VNKKVYIAGAVLLALILVAFSCVAIFHAATKPPESQAELKEITVFDSKGAVLLQTKKLTDMYDAACWAYLEIALNESAQIIAQKENCTTAEATKLLFSQGCQIHTAFDSVAFAALKEVEEQWGSQCNTACAITDLQGGLLAVRCSDKDGKQANYLLERRSPYSSFKALSVYTPAVEKGIANWSSLYQDTPYKQMKDKDGKLKDWPANVTNTYSKENVTVHEALKTSLNTVAVKCLADVGISDSMKFLQTNFGIPLKEEEFAAKTYGEEEIIGSIALGYLETGITPIEMAGYYQIFANGGLYSAPKAVNKITGEDGAVLYTAQLDQKQVVSAATADTMNKLLQGVVANGGTGAMANCHNVQVAGKTGTGDDYADNWFVGVTPSYSLAVWHGKNDSNQAAQMFSTVIETLYNELPDANRKFVTHHNLYQIAYCVHSGKAFSPACSLIDVGYFENQEALPVCDTCSKP
jgi:penicillin-binding protein 1A